MPGLEERVRQALIANAVNPAAASLAASLSDLLGAEKPGTYSAAMIPLLIELQVSLGVGRDGIVGENTKKALARQSYLDGVSCDGLWPDVAAPAGVQREHYLSLCRKIDPDLPGDKPVLLGLRGVYPFGRKTHRMIHAMRYDDTFVLLQGDAEPFVFRGATHAYQLLSSDAPNADLKGQDDVGSIRPGIYVLHRRDTKPIPIFHVKLSNGSGDLPAYRDTNHDGVISPEEAEQSVSATKGEQVTPGVGMFANAVLFHPGYETIEPGKNRPFSSIACQTAALADVERLSAAGSEIHFVLANAADLVPVAGAVPSANVA